jgi:UDP-N-acetylglucosamine--N-acetylmuramyl-(pentapeptide) pyrophosphoryl-undecaprenol N-acetylglucosamine transferase
VSRPIVLAAGGTGGHVFPAQALAAELATRGLRLALVTDRRGGRHRAGFDDIEIHEVRSGSPRRQGLDQRLASIAATAVGTVEAAFLLRRLRPAAVVGFGGYPSLPTMIAATRLRIPCLVHEQNAVLGRANRFVARRVAVVATSFPHTARIEAAANARIVQTGNPVRLAFLALADQPYEPPAEAGPVTLFAMGGSQGARSFSAVLPDALSGLPDALRARLRVVQQCRAEDLESTRTRYADARIDATLAEFFDDVADELSRAHLVIARAGASSVAEIAVAGRPALLVPYPFSADDHQTANARAIADANAGWLIAQHDFEAAPLRERIATLLAGPETLAATAAAARRFARPDAARDLANLVEDAMTDGHRLRSEAPGASPASENAA